MIIFADGDTVGAGVAGSVGGLLNIFDGSTVGSDGVFDGYIVDSFDIDFDVFVAVEGDSVVEVIVGVSVGGWFVAPMQGALLWVLQS